MSAKEFLSSLVNKEIPEELAATPTTFHFNFGADANYTVLSKDGKVEFHDAFIGTPECTVKAEADDFMSIVNGDTNPMMAMMMGKLKISNPSAMLKYAKVFGIM